MVSTHISFGGGWANLVIQQRRCFQVCQVGLGCKFWEEDGFKERVKARVVWGQAPLGKFRIFITTEIDSDMI